MAATHNFVVLNPGAWVSVCEYRESRHALLVESIASDIVLAMNTSGPTLATPYGNFPAGFFQSISDGNGPGCFRLSRELDGDATIQQWFAWTPTLTPSPPPTVGSTSGITNPLVLAVPCNAGDLVMVICMVADTGPGMPVCVSAYVGTVAPFRVDTLNDGLGDTGIMAWFKWIAPASNDTVTLSNTPASNLSGAAITTSSVAVDVSTNGATGGGLSQTIVTPSLRSSNETAITGILSYGMSAQGSFDPAWTYVGLVGFVSPSGTQWACDVGFQVTTTSVPVSMTDTWPLAQTDSVGAVYVFGPNSLQASSNTISVVESFELAKQPAEKPKRFSVPLPKLSEAGILALRDLQKKIQ